MLNFLFFISPIYWSKKRLISRRKYFFDAILEICSSESDSAAQLMQQNEFDVFADRKTAVIDADKGVLIFSVPAEYHGIVCHHTYSIWQTGDILKVGILLKNGLEAAPLIDINREVSEIWHGVPYHTIEKGSSTMYEWTFSVPHLYKSWENQEHYVLGMTHCRQRMLRIIHDYAKLQAQRGKS